MFRSSNHDKFTPLNIVLKHHNIDFLGTRSEVSTIMHAIVHFNSITLHHHHNVDFPGPGAPIIMI